MSSVVNTVRPVVQNQEPPIEMASSLTFDLSPLSGLYEAVPQVPPDPCLRGQRGHQRDPERGRVRIGDGEALYDRHRRPQASQTGTFESFNVLIISCICSCICLWKVGGMKSSRKLRQGLPSVNFT